MFTVALLREQFTHLEWAEALVWSAALGAPAALADAELHDRLKHIHLTQRAFLDVWLERPMGRYLELRFASLRDLHDYARPWYTEAHAFLDTLDDARLATPTPVPWARWFAPPGGEPGATTLGETCYQVVAHSAYHRAQVNTRLRALGVEPPLVDYIAWLWHGRPSTTWTARA